MKLPLPFTLAVSLMLGCGTAPQAGDGVNSATSDDLTVQDYNAPFEFSAPDQCDVFMLRRLVDSKAHAAEYDLRIGTPARELSLVYSIDPTDQGFPVQAKVTTSAGVVLFAVKLSDTSLSIRDSTDAEAMRVERYASANAGVTVGRPLAIDQGTFDAGMRALRCLLPGQTRLGFVPAFVLNRSDGARTGDNVTTHNADAPQLVPWNAPITVLGALWVAAASVTLSGATLRWNANCRPATPHVLMGSVAPVCALETPPSDYQALPSRRLADLVMP